VEEDWLTSIRSSRRVQGWAWEEEEVTGGGFPTAAEAAAERSSSARGLPARRAVKFWPSSCSRRRGSYWGGWIIRRRGGRMGAMARWFRWLGCPRAVKKLLGSFCGMM
jgi:hypothetical protein